MSYSDQAIDIVITAIIFLVGIYVIWNVGLALFGSAISFLVSAVVIVFFIYLFLKVGLDL